jgi:hypothetical protein
MMGSRYTKRSAAMEAAGLDGKAKKGVYNELFQGEELPARGVDGR